MHVTHDTAALFVPFFNGVFSGKVARLEFSPAGASRNGSLTNLQELDLSRDRSRRNVYKGYRGGFTCLWQTVWP